MTQKQTNAIPPKAERKKYSPQFKEQFLERAKKDGVAKVAKDLGIDESTLYNWRKQSESTGIPFEDQKIQAAELARLKREVSRLSDENAFLKKMGKKAGVQRELRSLKRQRIATIIYPLPLI